VARLSAETPDEAKNLEIVFAGRRTGEQSAILARLDGLPCRVRVLDYVDHREAVRMMREASGLCLLLSSLPAAERVVPAKLFEYMAARRPILGVVPDGECRDLLEGHPRRSSATGGSPGPWPGRSRGRSRARPPAASPSGGAGTLALLAGPPHRGARGCARRCLQGLADGAEMSLFALIASDLRAKAEWCYESASAGPWFGRAHGRDAAMVLYRLMQWSRRWRLVRWRCSSTG